jgi:hypothetical protein
VGDLFNALSGGLARFVFAWIMPSLISVGIFSIFLWPAVEDTRVFAPIQHAASKGTGAAAIVFSFFVLTLAVTFAYASLPIYQVLEGYSLPSFLKKPLLRRQRREFLRFKELERRFLLTQKMPRGVTIDDFRRFPSSLESVRATRLGNALTAMESWASDRYHLDSQTMWHELQGVSNDRVRRDTDDGRAPVDFFVSAIAHMVSLVVICIAVAAFLQEARIRAVTIALIALSTLPLSYHLAIRNMIDWSLSVKAMVNLGRAHLADALGLEMPAKLQDERQMWSAHYWAVELNQARYFKKYNSFRRSSRVPVIVKSFTRDEARVSTTSEPD